MLGLILLKTLGIIMHTALHVNDSRNNIHVLLLNRFHKLVWGCHGMEDPDTPSGYLVGGADNGNVFVWNPAKLLENKEDPLIYKLSKHTGAVAALDVNPYQVRSLASGLIDPSILRSSHLNIILFGAL